MKISTKGRYATRVMLDLAEHEGENFISLKEIAGRQEISVKYLEQIISILSKCGYVISSRGSAGGYRLAKKPEEYTIGDILRAAEGSLAPVFCVDGDFQCDRKESCHTCSFWKGLYAAVNQYIDSVTLADLIKK